MTHRLYYTDAALRVFDAHVVAADIVDGRTHVVLDRTAFYPTSGGQPFDTGAIDGAPVIDVLDRDDGAIVHVVSSAKTFATGRAVHGEIDWTRRFDHMQQHTGQHMLSAAFDRLIGVRTVSFHLGTTSATIDLAREVTRAEIDRAEALANSVVWEDRPVGIRFVSADEAATLSLRKEPARTGELRLVDVADFDLSACGGTHVARTGAVGVIAVAASERFKGATRITFVCGGRALAAYGQLRDVVGAATRVVSVSPSELEGALGRMQAEAKEQTRLVRGLQEALSVYRAAELRGAAETIPAGRGVLVKESTSDAAVLKTLASAIVGEPGYVAVIVGTPAGDGTPVPVVVARSSGVEFDASVWMRTAAAALGGRGGGRPELAQGGVIGTPDAVLEFAKRTICG